jgi:hypothetical protein
MLEHGWFTGKNKIFVIKKSRCISSKKKNNYVSRTLEGRRTFGIGKAPPANSNLRHNSPHKKEKNAAGQGQLLETAHVREDQRKYSRNPQPSHKHSHAMSE